MTGTGRCGSIVRRSVAFNPMDWVLPTDEILAIVRETKQQCSRGAYCSRRSGKFNRIAIAQIGAAI